MNLRLFKETDFLNAVKALFEELNVPMHYVTDEPTTAKEILKENYKDNATFQLIDDVYFVGMVDDAAFEGGKSISPDSITSDYDGILIFAINLHQRSGNLLPTRSQLAEISRAFNRKFPYTPVVIIFKYHDNTNKYIAFANTERLKYKQEWREGEKVGKVSLLRDINIEKPHRGHEDIINQLKIPATGTKKVDSFAKLYAYWQEVFSVNILNKKFYQELSNWYFWAIKNVRFPNEPTQEEALQKKQNIEDLIQQHNATNVIRLLTRLLFTWFIKEKGLIPEELFDLESLQKDILKEISPYHDENSLFKEGNKESIYYKAILQNLFFATLNCPIEADGEDKRFRQFRGLETYGKHRGIDWMMRYKKYFKNPDAFLEMVNKVVPFLNGGLFECLDDKTKNLYIDGFSDQMTKGEQLIVPDYLFFGATESVDLSEDYGIKNKQAKQAAVKGLINILKSYKFTITENTPVEEDVALDPELLGKVFENLLASYNPETKTTARKQTGSFYTPREIVNYMVDESLIAYLKNVLEASSFNKVPEASSTSVPEASSFVSVSDASSFETFFFNPNDEIEITEGKLPHWYQKEVYYFVTFRLADSIPKDKVEQLRIDRENWKKKKKDKKEYTKEEWKEYNRLFNRRVEEWMNAGYGSCLLRKKKNADIVANALKHFDGKRYILDEWVVMPNHVHVLVKPKGDNKLSDILHSWKSFTANEINKIEGRSGQLWMHESYDHIVRNEDALKAIRNYIRQNPVKANIVVEASSFNKVPEASSFDNISEASGFDSQSQSKDALETSQSQSRDALDTMLHQLVSFDNINPFAAYPDIAKQIVYALDRVKILDPAAGSGAFPMGALQKMVHILQKLDPDNEMWKELQLEKAMAETKDAYGIEDKKEREQKLIEINNAFDEQINDPDFARKLYLIENCIYGVDIQPIATQISKLRFFISLVVDQKVQAETPNFGIRPLPNLETKFVTANTLIGIEKEDSLFYTDEVKELENELKKIRHKLFNARTKETKLKYRQKDEELRNKIAEVLKEHGLPLDDAEKLAQWDPYDQNASSPFFDPEWMFGIKDGFDIVIGNPPYASAVTMARSKEIKNLYKKLYPLATGAYDIFILFLYKAIELTNNSGQYAWIIPNKFLIADYAAKTKEHLIKNGLFLSLDVSSFNVFENTSVYPIVILGNKNKKQKYKEFLLEKYTDLELRKYKKPVILKKHNLILDFNLKLASGATGFEAKKIKELLIEHNKENSIPFTVSGGIDRYKITNQNIRYMGLKLKNAYVTNNDNILATSKWDLWKKPKIIIAGMTKEIESVFVPESYGIGVGVYCIYYWGKFDPYYITAVLNSKYLTYYLKIKFKDKHLAGGYLAINKSTLEKLPFEDTKYQNIFIILSKLNHFFHFEVKNIVLNNIIDAGVFEIFFPNHMKERGIDVLEFVEQDINDVMQGREFEQLSDTKKEQVIEQLHQKWTDPDNEVVKRMAMFKEKSPDILKPILES